MCCLGRTPCVYKNGAASFRLVVAAVEVSPSGNGCHAIGRGKRFTAYHKDGIEIYCEKRFPTTAVSRQHRPGDARRPASRVSAFDPNTKC